MLDKQPQEIQAETFPERLESSVVETEKLTLVDILNLCRVSAELRAEIAILRRHNATMLEELKAALEGLDESSHWDGLRSSIRAVIAKATGEAIAGSIPVRQHQPKNPAWNYPGPLGKDCRCYDCLRRKGEL